MGLLDLLLFYVETGTRFTNDYGDIDERFYISLESVLDDFANGSAPASRLLFGVFAETGDRLHRATASIGWGYGDAVSEIVGEMKASIWDD